MFKARLGNSDDCVGFFFFFKVNTGLWIQSSSRAFAQHFQDPGVNLPNNKK